MRRAVRLTLFLLALLLSLPLFLKGRASPTKGDAAFLMASGNSVVVRLAGAFPRPGVYRFPCGITVTAVTKMTLPSPTSEAAGGINRDKILISGDILTLHGRALQPPVLSLERMGAQERILYGIPLDPDTMEPSDWCALPGLGPALAARIVEDRHKNGAFGSVEGLLRVPGIGPGKLSRIRRYF